jgi:acetolactate synthase-1/2/3 large subunit
MNGAESLIKTLLNNGVEVCFTNPGTSEMHFVAALDSMPGMRAVLGLFEGVATGAADGYARMAGKPACTLLHLGAGLGNGIANLHNARRAYTPVVNIVGDHATYHKQYDAPLQSDIESIARGVSGWVRTTADPRSVAADAAEAVAAAMGPPGRVATLILPADNSWSEAAEEAWPANPPVTARTVPAERIGRIAAILQKKEPALFLLNGTVLLAPGLELAGRIAGKSGAKLYSETFAARVQRGAGAIPIERFPYFGDQAREVMASVRHLILVGAKAPVAFFAYPGQPSNFTPDGCQIHTLARLDEDGTGALRMLADALGAGAEHGRPAEPFRPPLPTGALDSASVAATLGALLPERAIVCDEAVTAGFAIPAATQGAPLHDWLSLTGGAIGQGLPLAIGAAIACPDRKVVSLEGDGSAMYTIQALWTQARENLDITTVIFNNASYAILQFELMRVGVMQAGPNANKVLNLGNPRLNFAEMARAMGVPAARVTSAAEFNDKFAEAMAQRGPQLIEVML